MFPLDKYILIRHHHLHSTSVYKLLDTEKKKNVLCKEIQIKKRIYQDFMLTQLFAFIYLTEDGNDLKKIKLLHIRDMYYERKFQSKIKLICVSE
jgi:hypothetical protein